MSTAVKNAENPDQKVLRVSVRNLVEFLLREGDLRSEGSGFADRDAMQAGGRAHRRLQKHRSGGYQAEVPLSYTEEYKATENHAGFCLQIEGRADGVYHGHGFGDFSHAIYCDSADDSSAGTSERFEEAAFRNQEVTVIEEIKGIFHSPAFMERAVPVHLAQAKCYAYIYGLQHPEIFSADAYDADSARIYVCMTYVGLEKEETRQFLYAFSRNELTEWFHKLLQEYAKWAAFEVEWEEKKNRSVNGLPFPYTYRPGQHELTADIYRTILRSKELFVQAPTGIGKTMSAVFPSVHALGAGLADKIFYLTAKTITRTVAENAFADLRGEGLCLKDISLTAKEKICILDEPECNPDRCPRAKGHYDRVNDAVFDLLITQDHYSREVIEKQAEKWQVCPHELQLDLSAFADAVICDYNYVFDPDARLKRFFGEGSRKGSYIFLVDEAHNLVERGREMFSAGICRKDFLTVRRLMKAAMTDNRLMKPTEPETGQVKPATSGTGGFSSIRLAKADCEPEKLCLNIRSVMHILSSCSRILLKYSKDCEGEELKVIRFPDDLLIQLMNLCGGLEDLLSDLGEESLRKSVLDFYFSVRSFVSISDLVDDHYLVYGQRRGQNDFLMKLFCVNPSANLQNCLDRGRSAVFFSATLLPVNYYRRLLTTREDTYAVYIPSPFDRKNRLIIAGSDVSSRYKRRGHDEYTRIASYIRRIAEKKNGNYMVFFPSYQMLDNVFDLFCAGSDSGQMYVSSEDASSWAARSGDTGPSEKRECEKIACIRQKPQMTESERERFLEAFRTKRQGILVGFCVLGGIFAEGIDLTGESLIGAIIVGTGLPQIGPEKELLREHYGFDYAYRYPGMNKVLQAAGRVIRTSHDCGIIALLDDRFLSGAYRTLFPREWADMQRVTLDSVGKVITDFWDSLPGNDKTV
ncbi:MAG: ATP-dependent DNA helicase [Bilifractor sp.]